MTPKDGMAIDTPRGRVIIRAGVEGDAPAYRDLRLEALLNHPDAFSSDYETFQAKPPGYWVERLRFDSPDNAAMMFFAAHDEALVGMCGVAYERAHKTRHSAYLISMYVRPEWRGSGVADALIAACLEWARDRGVTVMKLGVATTNTPAIRCYARCEFQVYGIEPRAVYHDGVFYDELLMVRTM